jgi:hypothetical protein
VPIPRNMLRSAYFGGWAQIANMLGHYSFTLAENVMKGELRPLNQPSELIGIP